MIPKSGNRFPPSRSPTRRAKGDFMRRREFLTLLGGTAAARPLAAGAQPLPIRRLGVLFVLGEDHPEVPSWLGALKDGLRSHGWIEGQTLQIELRFGSDAVGRCSELGGPSPLYSLPIADPVQERSSAQQNAIRR